MLEAGADSGQVAAVQQQIQDALRGASQSMLASMESMRNQDQDQNPAGGGGGASSSADLADGALPEAVMTVGDDWGNLPGDVKNQILQAMGEGYPKEFEKMIQIYFRGLAETSTNDEE